uniref:C2 domain-containing protein n=1 Tax=Takifugu rubripes TaxID=31033 RepID=A0A674MZJ3_TAKRU
KHIWFVCVQASPAASSLVGYIGTPTECAKAHFVPGYNLGGEGFDVVTMERKGRFCHRQTETWKTAANGSCRLYRNRILPQCSLKWDSMLYTTAPRPLVNDSASSVSNNWKVGLEIPLPAGASVGVGLGGSTPENQPSHAEAKQDATSFSPPVHPVQGLPVRMSKKPLLNAEFLSVVNSLLNNSHGSASVHQSIKTCEARHQTACSTTEVSDCLVSRSPVGQFWAASVRIKAMTETLQSPKKEIRSTPKITGSMLMSATRRVTGREHRRHRCSVRRAVHPSVYDNWLKSRKRYPTWSSTSRTTPSPLNARKDVRFGHRSNKRDPCACVCNSSSHIKSNCCPNGKGLATLKVFRLYAQNLYGDRWSQTDGSVEVTYGNVVKRTNIISNNDNPVWGETFEFGPITMSMANKLRFRVYDEDQYWNSDLLGECSFELHSGKADVLRASGGIGCQEYIPASMSPSLKEVFYTRNGVLLGEQDNRPKSKLQHL